MEIPLPFPLLLFLPRGMHKVQRLDSPDGDFLILTNSFCLRDTTKSLRWKNIIRVWQEIIKHKCVFKIHMFAADIK